MTRAWSQFVPGWRKMLSAHKWDRTKPNPFEEPDPGRFIFIRACTSKLNNFDRWCIGQVEDPTREGGIEPTKDRSDLPP